MRLANLAAFQRYAKGLNTHKITLADKLKRLDRALEQSDPFLSPREFQRCADFVQEYTDSTGFDD